MHRPAWVEIDLNAVSNNLDNIRNRVGNKTMIIAIVKANAYGHGIENVSKRLAREGVEMFGVATVEDAIKLRENGIDNPILLLGCILPDQIESIVMYSLTPTIVNYHIAEKLSNHTSEIINSISNSNRRIYPVGNSSRALSRNMQTHYSELNSAGIVTNSNPSSKFRDVLSNGVNAHVKIDTGMGGFGISSNDAVNTIKKIKELSNFAIDGIFTHFTSPDGSDKDAVNEQLNLFNDIVAKLESLNIHIPIKHTDNSSIISQNPLSFNAIRPGIGLYGLYSSQHVPRSIDLQQVMSFKTRIVNIKKLNKGDTVSYGRTYRVHKESLIATLPVGYSDGYRRELSNKGNVLVRCQRAPVVGLVRMDFSYIDVTNVSGVNVGDEVVLFGRQGNETISIESIAKDTDAIPYEITCGIGKDVPRIYINDQ